MVVDLNTERQNEQFGGMNREKNDILSPITAKKHEKTQNFTYQNFKVKFDPVPTPPSKFFHHPIANFLHFNIKQ